MCPAGNDPCGIPCPGAGPAKTTSTKREGVAEARPKKKYVMLDTKVNKKAMHRCFSTPRVPIRAAQRTHSFVGSSS